MADFLSDRPTRRAMLTMGSVGLTGLSLSGFLKAQEASRRKSSKATAKNVIMLFQFGGASHIDSFDPKPDAPAEIRGEFKSIPSKVPGSPVTEHLPRLAARADQYALLRR